MKRLVWLLATWATVGSLGCVDAPVPDEAPLYTSPAEAVYVGREACSRCHLGIFASFSDTGMARSVETRPREAIVIGSGHHASALFTEEDSGWVFASLCRYAEQSGWVPCPDDSTPSPHVAPGPVAGCLYCHASAPRAEGPPVGVDCERCHGPGSTHVERWRSNPAGADDPAIDRTIVNPRRLPHTERMAVCLQCHLGDAAATAILTAPGAALYRPGLSPAEWLVMEPRSAAATDQLRVSAQGGRLMRSACYLESAGKLDCLTCHNPHVTVYLKDRPQDQFRRICLTCHAADDCGATLAGDDCVSCHMAQSEPVDQPHTTYTDHWIR